MMAIETLKDSPSHETPIVVSADSWTGGPAPVQQPSKLDAWANSHPVAFPVICVATIALAETGNANVVHHLSVAAAFVLFLFVAASVTLTYGTVIGFILLYAWLVNKVDHASLREMDGFGRGYITLLLVVGFFAGLIAARVLASELPIIILRHL